jgi:hypothetical protein
LPEPTAPTLPSIQHTEVDGVPLLWADAPGQPILALHFRVGRADERAWEGGLTHFVEHLAMGTIGQPRYEHNAWVDTTRTVFYANGSPVDVASFGEAITTALASLPTDRLEHERSILTREGAGQSPGISDSHLNFRFGMTGFGLSGQPEFGLGAVTAERVAEWVRERFGRGNVMAFMTGTPPSDLRLELNDGAAFPNPRPVPEPTVPLPSHVMTPNGGVALGFLLERKVGAGTFLALYHRMLRQRLRLERGLIYDVLADYQPLDATWAAALVGGECDPKHAQEVADIALDELTRLMNGEVDQAELDAETADFRQNMEDPTQVAGLLDSMVRDELAGMPFRSAEERYREQQAVTAEHIAGHAAQARRSLLLLADVEQHTSDIVPYPMSSTDIVAGREVKPLLSVLGFGPKVRLTIGPDGVSLRAKDGSLATVRYQDCVVLERPKDDELVLWGRDLSRVYVPAAFWRGGEQVLAEIEAAVPPEIVVRDTFSHDYIED